MFSISKHSEFLCENSDEEQDVDFDESPDEEEPTPDGQAEDPDQNQSDEEQPNDDDAEVNDDARNDTSDVSHDARNTATDATDNGDADVQNEQRNYLNPKEYRFGRITGRPRNFSEETFMVIDTSEIALHKSKGPRTEAQK